MWTKLVKQNDWGSYYYAPDGKSLTPGGRADFSLGIKFENLESLAVRFPDGTEQRCPLRGSKTLDHVGDMGRSYNVGSVLWFVEFDVHGLSVPIEVDKLDVWIE